MESWIDTPQERQKLASKLNARYRKSKHKQQVIDATTEKEKTDNVWKDACEKGKSNGKIRLCWLVDLKHISNRVYSYQSDYGRELQELVLDGIGLTILKNDLFKYCVDLIHLSLASNHISDIAGIHSLRKLLHLNLLCNNLTDLPASIGNLANLTQLDVANNKLANLPHEICQLCQLEHLNLECNELSELPVSFGKLSCKVVNLNYNNFTVFPDCILDMPRLRQFSIMANEIGNLSVGMERFKYLEVFHASRNRITILPDSIVEIPSLQCLWLDYNKISALPPNFHRLRRLKVLKLEGNTDMVYPSLKTITMGVEEVLRWSRGRLETKKTTKVRQIVQSLEEVLSLVQRHRIGGDLHESLFQVNGNYYQFPPDALWSVFIPELRKVWSNPENNSNDGIQSFAFERNEVEQAIFEFRDAAGPIVKRLSNARFHRCSCDLTGRRPVCIPPKVGWMCQRPAIAVRMKVAYEENMREKRRLLEEEKRIEDAASATEAIAKSFLESDDGMIMVRDEAEKRLSLRKQSSSDSTETSSAVPISKRIFSGIQSLQSQLNRSHQRELRHIEEEIKVEYTSHKVSEKTQQVMDGNKKVRWIMKSWLGVTNDEVFKCWRDCVEVSKKQRRRKQRENSIEERLRYEDEMATYESKKLEASILADVCASFNSLLTLAFRARLAHT